MSFYFWFPLYPSVLWHYWPSNSNSIQPVKTCSNYCQRYSFVGPEPIWSNVRKVASWIKAKTGIQRVQALADISHSAIWCHSNETRAPIANPPNSAQLEGIYYHSPNIHLGSCSSVGCSEGQTTDTQTAVSNIHFASAMPHAKCKQ